jgi:hypothetical protein
MIREERFCVGHPLTLGASVLCILFQEARKEAACCDAAITACAKEDLHKLSPFFGVPFVVKVSAVLPTFANSQRAKG